MAVFFVMIVIFWRILSRCYTDLQRILRKDGEDELVWFFISAVIVIGALIYAGFFFYGIAIKRAPKEFLSNNRDLKVDPRLPGLLGVRGRIGSPVRALRMWRLHLRTGYN